MLRKMMLMATGVALGLGVTASSLATEVFNALTALKTLDLKEMVMVTEDGRTYRLSPESVPQFEQQQGSGQLKEGRMVRISGHYGSTPDGDRQPFIERIQAVSP